MQKEIEKKFFVFEDKCICLGCVKLSLLGKEYLSTPFNVLTNSLKILHITERDFLQFNSFPFDQ